MRYWYDLFLCHRLNFPCAVRSKQPRKTKANSPPIFSGGAMLKQLGKEAARAIAEALRALQLLQRLEFGASTPACSQGQPLAEG
jgi:hypothetical protein